MADGEPLPAGCQSQRPRLPLSAAQLERPRQAPDGPTPRLHRLEELPKQPGREVTARGHLRLIGSGCLCIGLRRILRLIWALLISDVCHGQTGV